MYYLFIHSLEFFSINNFMIKIINFLKNSHHLLWILLLMTLYKFFFYNKSFIKFTHPKVILHYVIPPLQIFSIDFQHASLTNKFSYQLSFVNDSFFELQNYCTDFICYTRKIKKDLLIKKIFGFSYYFKVKFKCENIFLNGACSKF